MPILGWFLFILGFLLFFAANLQHTDFLILLPSYIAIICGTGLLLLSDWRHNKNSQKKISILAILCFILGFLGFIVQEGNNWLYFSISILSIIFGIVFKINGRKEQGKLVGNSLFLTGIILGVTIFGLALLSIVFKIN